MCKEKKFGLKGVGEEMEQAAIRSYSHVESGIRIRSGGDSLHELTKNKSTSPERFELSRANPMYLAGTRLNHSAKATLFGTELWLSFK